MRPYATFLLLLGLLGAAAPAAATPAAAPEEGRASAAQVDLGRASAARQLKKTERALAATAQAARAPRAELAPRSAAARPFWDAIDQMSRALGRADIGLRAADAQYFAALGEGSRALTELEVVWARTRHHAPAVDSGIAALSASYRRLRNGYGWEALRRRQGGALTAAEARRFHALRQADAQVAVSLKPVQARVVKAGDKTMAQQLTRLREQAQRIATAELTLEAYLTAELLNDIVQGEWAASQHYVKKPYRAAWHKAAPAIEKLATDPGVGFVFTADLSKAEAWSFDDGSAETGAGEERGATAPAAAARDDTPVDEVEIVDGETRRTEGVAPAPVVPAEPGVEDPASPDAPAPEGAAVETPVAPALAEPAELAQPSAPSAGPAAEDPPAPSVATASATEASDGSGEPGATAGTTMQPEDPDTLPAPEDSGAAPPPGDTPVKDMTARPPENPPPSPPVAADPADQPPADDESPDAEPAGAAPVQEPDMTARPPENPPPTLAGDPAEPPPPAAADPLDDEPPPPPPPRV